MRCVALTGGVLHEAKAIYDWIREAEDPPAVVPQTLPSNQQANPHAASSLPSGVQMSAKDEVSSMESLLKDWKL